MVNSPAAKGACYPKTSPEAKGWRWVAARLAEYHQLAQTARSAGARARLAELQHRFCRWRPPASKTQSSGNHDAIGLRIRQWARGLQPEWGAEAKYWAEVAKAQAGSLEAEFQAQASRSMRRWAKEACAGGARGAHRWTKDPMGFQAGAPPLEAQSTAEAALKEWMEVWENVPPDEALPARSGTWLPQPTAQQVRRAAATFPNTDRSPC